MSYAITIPHFSLYLRILLLALEEKCLAIVPSFVSTKTNSAFEYRPKKVVVLKKRQDEGSSNNMMGSP